MVRNTNDGSQSAPALHVYLNVGTLSDLPAFSKAPRGPERSVYAAVKAAGYVGMQGPNPALLRELGMGAAGGGRVNKVGEADKVAEGNKAAGNTCATLHVGWGMEDDDEVDRLVEDILGASQRHDFPLYIETHRATITQDLFRTVRFARKFPEVRFNGDFSHWYTGLEMVYGGAEVKMDFAAPVFERVRFVHGRIGNPGSMQVDIGTGIGPDGKPLSYVAHFKEMWTRCFAGFLKTAAPGDFITFAPELLQPAIYYGRMFKNEKGEMVEECDRWEQALVYAGIAKEAFAGARERIGN